MTTDKSRAEIAAFDALIADPSDKEEMIAKQNMIAQQQLAGFGMPPPRRRPAANGNGGEPNGNGGEPH